MGAVDESSDERVKKINIRKRDTQKEEDRTSEKEALGLLRHQYISVVMGFGSETERSRCTHTCFDLIDIRARQYTEEKHIRTKNKDEHGA